jgi:glycopeptide antibiotics resistance protein
VPLGFLLPLLWKRFEKMRLTLLFGFLLSLAIEIAQLLTHRATDIDDILMNTLGTIIGYYLYICIKKILHSITEVFHDKEAVYFRREVYVYVGIAWITVIFTQRFMSSLLVQLLYR